MACLLSQGRDLGCRDQIGGILRVAFMPWTQGLTVTLTSNEVSALGNVPSLTTAYKYELPRNTGFHDNAITGSRENGTVFFTQNVVIMLHALSGADRAELVALAQGRWVAFVEDSNGNIFVAGLEKGLEVQAGNLGATGTATGDMSGYTIELTSEESVPSYHVATSDPTDFDTDVAALSANLSVS